MRRLTWLIAIAVALWAAMPIESAAQQQPQPETRVITITTFVIPPAATERFNEHFDKYLVPELNEDPNVLSYRLARHYWGTNEPNAWLITEYASLDAVQRSEEWTEQWRNQRYPEGSPEREELTRSERENFMPVFLRHTDNILLVNMRRAKR